MSNLFKSKFVLGLMVAAAVILSTGTASAAITSTLKLGSNNSQVKELQQGLNSKGFVVSTSGAGSVGSETNYFGSKTKTAVQAYQASKGLTADGIFGPASRASWTGTTSTGGNYPAGCTSSAGFSPITGVSCSTGVSTTLPAGCSSTSGFSSTTGQPCSGSTSQTGPVTVALSSNNPASSTLVAGQATANLANFTFSGSGTVTAVTLQRIGVSADATPSNVYLFDGATRLTDAASVSNNGTVTFNVPSGIFTVNGTKTISVKSDIAANTSGQTVGMMLATVTAGGTTSTVNLSGNIHSIANATLAGVTSGIETPTNATLNPGANVTVWQSSLNISQRDVWMKRVAFRNVGSAPANAFGGFKLYVNGVQVATAAGVDVNGYVTFDMTSTPVMLQSGTRVVRVDADIVSGASRTVHFSLRSAADVDFVDSSFGVNIVPGVVGGVTTDPLPWAPATESTISGQGGGSLIIEKDVSSSSTNATLAGNDVKIATYKVTAYGEPIKIENIRASFTTSDNAVDSLRNGRIVIGGVQYGSTSTLMEDSSTPAYTQYTLNYTVNPGTPVLMDLHADMFDNDGTNDLTAGDTIIGVIAIGSSNAQKVDSLGSFNAPGTAVNGNTLTVASATVSLTKNATYANQSVSLPATGFKIGSWNVAGSSVEDVLLTTVSFDEGGSADDFDIADDLTNMYIVVKDAAGNIVSQPSPLATVSATGNAFSINHTLVKNTNMSIELYANLGSAATVGTDFDIDLTLTGTASVSGTAVAPAVTTGQTITAGTASITATTDASTPVAAIVHDNQTVTAAAFKFAAITAGYNVTDLTFTLGNTTVAQSVELYDGATLIASKPGASPVTFNGLNWNVPANQNKVLTVKLVLGSVGIGAGDTGSSQLVTLSTFTATNTSTGTSDASANDAGCGNSTCEALENGPAGNAMYAYAATPTITAVALSGDKLKAGENVLSRFTITSNGGTIEWSRLFFEVSKTADPVLTNAVLWDVTANAEVAGTDTLTTVGATNTSGTIEFDATAVQQVSGTKTYELRMTAASVDIDVDYVVTKLAGDAAYAASDSAADVETADSDVTIIWSDVSASGHSTTTNDWTGEYGVKNLPISQTVQS
ncbi:MAG: peptidoglycan-binding domain-containing protein [Candidatus Paceibacterota bacterium]